MNSEETVGEETVGEETVMADTVLGERHTPEAGFRAWRSQDLTSGTQCVNCVGMEFLD